MKALLMLLLAVLLGACGSDGAIGESCATPGSTSQCVSGAVCTNTSSTGSQCRKLCTEQAQCAQNENCNGISGSNLKSCQPD